MTNDDINFLKQKQYIHISEIIVQTEKRLERIRNGGQLVR